MRGGGHASHQVAGNENEESEHHPNSDHRMTAQDAVFNLETETEMGEDDYDPTQELQDDNLDVYAQGQLEEASISRQLEVSRVENME